MIKTVEKKTRSNECSKEDTAKLHNHMFLRTQKCVTCYHEKLSIGECAEKYNRWRTRDKRKRE